MIRAVLRSRWLVPCLLALVGLALSSFLVIEGTRAAYAVPTSNAADSFAAGTVSLTDDDSATAMFTVGNLQPGDSGSKCIRVSYGGTLPAEVKLMASAVSGGLAPYVDVAVLDGPVGSTASCATFDARSLLYGGAASDFPTTYAISQPGPFAPLGSGQSRAYRVVYTLDAATPDSAQGASLSIALRWEARNATPQAFNGWGLNFSGQLGIGNGTDQPSPVGAMDGDTDWADVAKGYAHTCATKADGSLYCWGNNTDGQAGSNDTVTRANPLRVGSATDWVNVGAGDSVSCATKTTGALYCWGSNGDGRLGVGDTTGRRVPTRVGVATDWAFVVGGGGHTCATKTTGALYCWGWNGDGQLGVNDTTQRTSPVRVGTDSDWAALGVGGNHVCATKTSGALYCWGRNSSGQLGLGNTTARGLPTRVGTGTDWATVAVGNDQTCAIKTSGALFCWGLNSDGQLGLGNLTNRTSPVQVGTDVDWRIVSPSYTHTCAIKGADAVYCWGDNTNGRLGLGDTTRRTSPTLVGTGYRDLARGGQATHTLAARRPT